MNSGFDTQFWGTRKRADRPKPYEVRWRVGEKAHSRSFAKRNQADWYRARLVEAAGKGEEFSQETGEPLRWARAQASCYSLARSLAEYKWGDSAANTRKHLADGLCQMVLATLDPRKAKRNRPDTKLLRKAIRQYVAVPSRWGNEPDDIRRVLEWVEQASLPASALEDREIMDRVLLTLEISTVSGKRYGKSSIKHHRTTLYMACDHAVTLKVYEANPLNGIPRRRSKGKSTRADMAIDPRTIPSHDQYRCIREKVPEVNGGAHLVAFFDLMYYAGCRPAEVIGLHVQDATLPEQGWGQIILSGGITDLGGEGQHYCDDGARHEQRELKHRDAGAVRIVPLAPYAVASLGVHIAAFPPAPDGRVFYGDGFKPLTGTEYRRVWTRARVAALTAAEMAYKLAQRPYDLRHGNASLLLGLRVPPAEVARRLGHSVQMLFAVYAHWLDDQVEYANNLIDQALERLTLPQVSGTAAAGPTVGQQDLPEAA